MSKSVSVYTLGCRVNHYESCSIAEELRKCGFKVNKDTDSDFYIVNTCAVTAESERKSRQLVRRCASRGKVLVIGCASQFDHSFFETENVIYIGGNRNKRAVVEFLKNNRYDGIFNNVSSMDGAPYEEMTVTEKDELFSECRAFIKIQDGCNGKCSYCIIPRLRGNVRSRDAESVVSEAELLIKSGYGEIILTGIEVGAYNKIPLGELVSRVAGICGLKRLRLGSLSPNVVSDKFLSEVSRHSAFMPHIHLSLQSCCDSVLADMKRPYRKKFIYERIDAIRRYIPDCLISADIIVGFPGESEENFLETVASLKELGIFHVHSFPYSERAGTPAAEMKGSVPKNVRSERNAFLIAECAEIKQNILREKCGKTVKVLIERIIDGKANGHTEEFLEAVFESRCLKIGDIADVRVISCDFERLICEII